MDPKTFIFIGRSGCGKGTQVKLLEEYLKKEASEHPVLTIETGDHFRAFLASGTYASLLAQEISAQGALQPDFLAVYMWADFLMKELKGNEHLILDGSPRRLREAMVLDSALTFFKRKIPVVIHIDVSHEWSKEKMKKRGRADDQSEEEVEKRLAWYDSEVVPALNWLRSADGYKVVEINGEQSIEDVYKEMISKIIN